jgi:predicted secreted protein
MNFMYALIALITCTPLCAAPPTTTITLQKGEIKHFELSSNPTTGYSWYLSKEIPKNAPIVVVKSGYQADDTGLVGSGGTQWWDIKGIKKGSYTLILEYKRPWEKNVKPVDRKKIVIIVR